MGILEFLFENPFLILVLLGALTTLFGRKKQQEQQQRQRQQQQQRRTQSNPMPVDQPIELPWEKYDSDVDNETSVPEASRNKGNPSPERSYQEYSPLEGYGYEEERTEQRQASSRSTRSAVNQWEDIAVVHDNRITDRSRSGKAELSAQASKLMDFKRINAQNVVQGIIWSQVLGQPRSREPHRTSKYSFGQRR